MRVLSVDGGGIRGLIPSMVLADLERRAGKPTADLFDLVAGTSTGGIIACALTVPGEDGRPRWSADKVADFYVVEGPKIFSRSVRQTLISGFGLIEEKYDDEALNDVLERYLGAARLSTALCDVLTTSYDLEHREPYFFKSWRPERDFRMWEAARATAAAPTYFEPLALREGERAMSLVDGGVFALNPAMCAYAEVRRRTGADPDIVVSLGTGHLTRPIHHEDAEGWGLAEWVRPVIDIAFDGVADTVEYQSVHLLGERFSRFQVALTNGASDELDDASPENLARLAQLARELIADRSEDLDRLAEQLSAPT